MSKTLHILGGAIGVGKTRFRNLSPRLNIHHCLDMGELFFMGISTSKARMDTVLFLLLYKIEKNKLYCSIRNFIWSIYSFRKTLTTQDIKNIELFNNGRLSKMKLASNLYLNLGELDYWLHTHGYTWSNYHMKYLSDKEYEYCFKCDKMVKFITKEIVETLYPYGFEYTHANKVAVCTVCGEKLSHEKYDSETLNRALMWARIHYAEAREQHKKTQKFIKEKNLPK